MPAISGFGTGIQSSAQRSNQNTADKPKAGAPPDKPDNPASAKRPYQNTGLEPKASALPDKAEPPDPPDKAAPPLDPPAKQIILALEGIGQGIDFFA